MIYRKYNGSVSNNGNFRKPVSGIGHPYPTLTSTVYFAAKAKPTPFYVLPSDSRHLIGNRITGRCPSLSYVDFMWFYMGFQVYVLDCHEKLM